MPTIKTQPAPVLPWHTKCAKDWDISDFWRERLAQHIARHDPHAETVRLLEASYTVVSNLGSTLAMMSSPDTRWESPMMTKYREHRDALRAHLAKLKGTG